MSIEILNKIVNKHWAESKTALLLSKIKSEMERENCNVDDWLNGRKLKDAILEDSKGHIRLIRNPKQPLVWGAVPHDSDLPEDQSLIFARFANKTSNSSEEPRFNRAVWLAFAKPILPEARRYLEIGPPSKYRDIYDDEEIPKLGIEVDKNFISNARDTPSSTEDHENRVAENIRNWANDNNIKIEELILSRRSRHDQSSRPHDHVNHFDYLDLSTLSPAEKARISIPLDLLSKIKFGRHP